MHTQHTILVTGGAGFVGRSLVRELALRGWRVRVIDDFSAGQGRAAPLPPSVELVRADVAAAGVLARELAAGDVAVLVHLAARVGVRTVLEDAAGCARANRLGVERLLEALRGLDFARRPRVFFASSSEVYAEHAGALAETHPLRADRAGRWAYAASKIEGERLLHAARALFPAARAPVAWRFFNVVGPGQSARSGMVLPTFVECARRGEVLPVHGDGGQVRTYALVDEVARTLAELIALRDLPGGALNVGGCARASVLELARCVLRHSGLRAGLVHVDPRRRLGEHFAEVATRQPELARLAATGVSLPQASLDAIVAETWRRHALAPEDAPRCASLAS